MRKILRRVSEEAATSQAAARISAEGGVVVLDEKPSSLLLEGEPDALSAIAERLRGWSLIDLSRVKLPDARARVKRPARSE
jgi:hypothetical protein